MSRIESAETTTVTAAVEDDVLVEVADGVATISLNRPHKLNAITPTMARRLTELMREVDDDPQVRAIVLRGNGRGLCAGADLSVLGAGPAKLAEFVTDPAAFPTVARQLRKPVIVAAKGPLAGIGIAYLACADIRFASTTASFTTSFARLGLVAEYGLAWLLPRLVGPGAAADLLLSGRTIDAQEAYRIGLVNALVDPDDLDVHVATYARDIAQRCSPRSTAIIKEQLCVDAHSDYAAAFERSLAAMVVSFSAADLGAALVGFEHRRPAQFPDLPRGGA
jgi:enoyl-CoA hydratase/carnithine racemase